MNHCLAMRTPVAGPGLSVEPGNEPGLVVARYTTAQTVASVPCRTQRGCSVHLATSDTLSLVNQSPAENKSFEVNLDLNSQF